MLFASGNLPTSGGFIQRMTWNLALLPSWRQDVRLRLVEVGWIPTTTDAPVFQLKAGNYTSDVIILPFDTDTQTYRRLDFLMPEGWDGLLTWSPGGLRFNNTGNLAQFDWSSATDAIVWARFEDARLEQAQEEHLNKRAC